MTKIKIKIAAKSDVGLERSNNEDNFQVSSDLLVTPMRWVNNEVCYLGEKGALLVVADGMGGMNAGEVASQIAIDTVREEFTPNKITSEVTKTCSSIEKFMNDVIIKADAKIKEVSKVQPDTKGMGTTIVIAWLFNNFLYVSWCGDSRAYVYNPNHGLHRLTKDHSYVQQLVDAGKLSDYEAFDFPDNNIITQCLCDAKQIAQPECLYKPYPVCDNDIILLCTDGLSSMIRDEEIQDVMDSFNTDMIVLADSLINSALKASGADNCTVCLCQVLSGGKKMVGNYFVDSSSKGKLAKRNRFFKQGNTLLKLFLICFISLFIGSFITWLFFRSDNPKEATIISNDTLIQYTDTIKSSKLGSISKDENRAIDSVDGNKIKVQELKKIDLKIDGLVIPRTKPDSSIRNSNEKEVLTQNNNIEDTCHVIEPREVVIEKLPDGVSLQQFAQRHDMNYLDMKRLNPNIKNWKTVQPGTLLHVYKK